MDLETYNATVQALNQRLMWLGTWPGQTLPATDLQHVAMETPYNISTSKPAALEHLLWLFGTLENRFIHNTVFQETLIAAPRYGHPQNDPDGWEVLPDAIIGSLPIACYYWQQGWGLWDRRATPMQHVAPRAYMHKSYGTLLSDWDEILADIRTGTAHLQYLPYTYGKEIRHFRQETFSTWDTFGNGTIDYETTTDTTGTGQYYPPYYELDYYTETGNVGNYGPNGSFQFQMYGTYETLQLINPYPYAIEITLLYVRLPTGATNTFIAGVGTCDTTYTLPTPRIKDGWWDSFDYGARFWNSVANAQRQTQTVTVPPYSMQTFGPTGFSDFDVPSLSQYLWINAPTTPSARSYECQGGQIIKLLAYYHPLTESTQTP
ncbi:MAG: hypothetical protein IJU53_04105 [Thermoguttaceae bacterium]|nr:hypothetical protein [Thermoguttaceae bacterium]